MTEETSQSMMPVTQPVLLTVAVNPDNGMITTAASLTAGPATLREVRALIAALGQVKAALEERRIELEVANKLQATEQPAKEEDHAAQDHDAVAAAVQLDGADAA